MLSTVRRGDLVRSVLTFNLQCRSCGIRGVWGARWKRTRGVGEREKVMLCSSRELRKILVGLGVSGERAPRSWVKWNDFGRRRVRAKIRVERGAVVYSISKSLSPLVTRSGFFRDTENRLMKIRNVFRGSKYPTPGWTEIRFSAWKKNFRGKRESCTSTVCATDRT